jgi:serine/threonine protein kinase
LHKEGSLLRVMIADFGTAHIITSVSAPMTEFCGTVRYLAPEVLMHCPGAEQMVDALRASVPDEAGQFDKFKFPAEEYGKKVDMWSLGITIYEALSGK